MATLAEVGGVVTYLQSLLPALVEKMDVTAAAYGDGPLVEAARAAGAQYVPLRHVRRPLSPWRDVLGLLEIYRLCREVRPDILHANSSKAGVLGRIAAAAAGVPIRIFSVHGWAFRAQRPPWLFLVADRAVERFTTLTICVSSSDRDVGIVRKTCHPDRTIVIPNGVRVDAEGTRRDASSEPTIAAVGRLKAPKDFLTLVRALALVEDRFRCVIIGEGPDRDLIEDEIDRLALRGKVALLGERHDALELLRSADVFVLATRSEAMPMSVLEAMAAGLPVVASRVGGIPEVVVDEQTGLLVPPADPAALASAIARMLGDPDARGAFGARGQERVRTTFSLERFRSDHLDAYQVLLEGRGLPAWAP
jgi:glycosyltransferase involved in cell wall biosynthesis